MILVDSSVWIDFFCLSSGIAGNELQRLIAEGKPLAVTGLVVTEVLQGLRRDIEAVERLFTHWDILEASGISTFRDAAAIYRLARSKGISLTTIDTLIAAITIEHGTLLFTLDQDFERIARFTSLRLYKLP